MKCQLLPLLPHSLLTTTVEGALVFKGSVIIKSNESYAENCHAHGSSQVPRGPAAHEYTGGWPGCLGICGLGSSDLSSGVASGKAGSCSASHWFSMVVSGPGSLSCALMAGTTMFPVRTVLFLQSSPSFMQKSLGDAP